VSPAGSSLPCAASEVMASWMSDSIHLCVQGGGWRTGACVRVFGGGVPWGEGGGGVALFAVKAESFTPTFGRGCGG
jgi:hypothetical protein